MITYINASIQNGYHIFTLNVYNNYTGSASDIVNVWVLETIKIPPTFNGTWETDVPNNDSYLQYNEGETGNFIKWIPFVNYTVEWNEATLAIEGKVQLLVTQQKMPDHTLTEQPDHLHTCLIVQTSEPVKALAMTTCVTPK